MNEHHGKPVSHSSDISTRTTLVIPGQYHTLSQWISIDGTTSNFCFFVKPDQSNGVFVRRYWCSGCPACKIMMFLECKNTTCGRWQFHEFKLKPKSNRKGKAKKPRNSKKCAQGHDKAKRSKGGCRTPINDSSCTFIQIILLLEFRITTIF